MAMFRFGKNFSDKLKKAISPKKAITFSLLLLFLAGAGYTLLKSNYFKADELVATNLPTVEMYEPKIEMIEDPFTGKGIIGAKLIGNVLALGASQMFEKGFEYAISTETGNYRKISFDTGPFSREPSLSGSYRAEFMFSPGSYKIRPYATNSFGTGYNNWIYFEIPSSPVKKIETRPATDISATTATLNGNGEYMGGATYRSTFYNVGFRYGTSKTTTIKTVEPNPFAAETFENIDIYAYANGIIRVPVANLLPNTTYYYQAYGPANDGAEAVGEWQQFTTSPNPVPEVETIMPTNITTSSIRANGNLKDNSSGAVMVSGFQFRFFAQQSEIFSEQTEGVEVPVGEFSKDIKIPDMHPGFDYAVRAFAVGHGTGYGQWIKFKAPMDTSVILTPNSDFQKQLTASTGAENWRMVNDAKTDDDASFVTISNNFATDLYGHIPAELPDNAIIHSVSINLRVSGSMSIGPRLSIDGIEYAGYGGPGGASQPGTWLTGSYSWTTNPKTNLPWTAADIDAMKFGAYVGAGGGTAKMTQIYAEVFYSVPNIIVPVPTVKTLPATEITTEDANLHGSIFLAPDANVTRLGFEFVKEGGEFIIQMQETGNQIPDFPNDFKTMKLTPNTKYLYRAFAESPTGIGFGDWMTLKTSQAISEKLQTTATQIVNSKEIVMIAKNLETDPVVILDTFNSFWGAQTNFGFKVTSDHLSYTYYKGVAGQQMKTDAFLLNEKFSAGKYFITAYANNANSTITLLGNETTIDVISYPDSPDPVVTYTEPVVQTLPPTYITALSVLGNAKIIDDGVAGDDWLYGVGFQIGTTMNSLAPEYYDFGVYTNGSSYSKSIPTLQLGTSYFIRAVAKNAEKTGYGNWVPFSVSGTNATAPTVQTIIPTDITASSALLMGNITADGGVPVDKRGFRYGLDTTTFIDTFDSGSFAAGSYSKLPALTGLTQNTTYFVQAYAINSTGEGAGQWVQFKTAIRVNTKPSVVTLPSADNEITYNSVVPHGTIVDTGGIQPTRRGFKWSKATDGSQPIGTTYDSGNFDFGDFSKMPNISLAAPSTTYYIQAFATNSIGTGTGEWVQFKTKAITPPTVTTLAPTNVTFNSVEAHGTISSIGDKPVTQRGFRLTKIAGTAVNGAAQAKYYDLGTFSTGDFTKAPSIPLASPNTNYYIQAYAASAAGTTYGDWVQFKTKAITPPTVTTLAPTNVTFNSVEAHGTISSIGDKPVTQRGFRLTKIAGTAVNGAAQAKYYDSGTFSAGDFTKAPSIPLASPNTTYYIQAYAINSGGVMYGEWIEFKTKAITLPAVTTLAPTNITYNSAVPHGNLTALGDTKVTARGFRWSKAKDGSMAIAAYGDTGTFNIGEYTKLPVISLAVPNMTYYIQAYAKNSGGTAYGDWMEFKTKAK
jgi:hypothetical protein